MAESQIENSLDYWKPKDIIIITNFEWAYKGIKATVVGDEVLCSIKSHGNYLSNKPNVIINLIENGLVDDINWIHDWDSFQVAPLDLPELKKDVGFVDYGYKPRIQLGNIFFKPEALDIFKLISQGIYKYQTDEEETTNFMVNNNVNNIKERIEMLNVTYNIGMRNIKTLIDKADKPIRIVHFPPYNQKYLNKFSKLIPPKLYKLLTKRFVK